MEARTHEKLKYYVSQRWSGLQHGIFSRHGGASPDPWGTLNVGSTVGDDKDHVLDNHERMYEALSVRGDRACTTWQVHGADVVIANGPVVGRRWLDKADALITDREDTPLVQRFADCTPLLFHDPRRGVIGLAHAGWRGTVQGMGASTVAAMRDAYGCRPADIEVVIGPSISVDHYQVGEEVVDAVRDYYGTTEGLIRRDPADGSAYFDLWAANQRDLQRAGVEQIELSGICTYQNTDDFYSHRGEAGRTGRFGVVISL